MILFQGLEDKNRPAHQAVMMFDAVKAKGVPVAYCPSRASNTASARRRTSSGRSKPSCNFYSKVFRFPLAESIEPVTIENL